MNIRKIRDSYLDGGLDYQNATVRACRDVILFQIAGSKMADHITVKGGVVVQQLSSDIRRATRDLDLDFVRYPMTNASIREFIEALCPKGSGIRFEIAGPIEDLKHQSYHGKRVCVRISDGHGASFETKLDLGVHDKLDIEQCELWFDSALNEEGVALMANSKEQICAEKIRALLRWGIASTRYRDVFDVYYLLCKEGVERDAFDCAMDAFVYRDPDMREADNNDVRIRLRSVLSNRHFRRKLENPRDNWLGMNVGKVAAGIVRYFE